MLQNTNGFVTSTLLSPVAGLVHAYTTRILGDMKKSEENRNNVIREVFGDKTMLRTAKQAHGNKVGEDSIVMKGKTGFALGVFTADCVPMLLVDTKKNILAAIHAGWRGTLGGITPNTLDSMKNLGSDVGDIYVSIGPHISMCHYDVPEERAQKFLAAFNHDPKVASYIEGAWRVDIGWANYRQLTDAGVKPEHIDAPPTCTFCQIDTYFSFRKDSKETFGEIMGVIGFA